MLFLSDVDKAQVILLSSGLEEQPESVQIGGSLVAVSFYTTVLVGLATGRWVCLAAVSDFCARVTCWRLRSAVNAAAARSFVAFKESMRNCSGVGGLFVTSAIFIQVFMQDQFCRNDKFNRGFSCVLFAER